MPDKYVTRDRREHIEITQAHQQLDRSGIVRLDEDGRPLQLIDRIRRFEDKYLSAARELERIRKGQPDPYLQLVQAWLGDLASDLDQAGARNSAVQVREMAGLLSTSATIPPAPAVPTVAHQQQGRRTSNRP